MANVIVARDCSQRKVMLISCTFGDLSLVQMRLLSGIEYIWKHEFQVAFSVNNDVVVGIDNRIILEEKTIVSVGPCP